MLDDISKWQHDHVFDTGNPIAERGTKSVMWITLVMMVIEIAGGWWYNSMALLADGWHMSSHALAIGLSAFAYVAARHFARDPRFAFGTWKIEILAGYTSAIFLLGVAVVMVIGSVERLLSPQVIHYPEAMSVAVIGLVVNVVCAFILGGAHHHDNHHHDNHHHDNHHHDNHHHDNHHHNNHTDHHDHSHHNDHTDCHEHNHGAHHHHDLNLKSAYFHVIADAATSVLAIIALAGGWIYGWSWLDPLMGIIGAGLIIVWARGLIIDTAKVLLDREMDHTVVQEIREVIHAEFAAHGAQLADLHVWRIGKKVYSVALVLVTHDQTLTPERVKSSLSIHEAIAHITVEINQFNATEGALT